jgi:uncharacterized NAD-dependent epimerase/dehydratase family protein
LALIHGSLPDGMILCHYPGRELVKSYKVKIPPLQQMIKLHEDLTRPIKPCRVIGISLNTEMLGDEQARAEIEKVEKETGLPAIDPVRFGCDKLMEAVELLKR